MGAMREGYPPFLSHNFDHAEIPKAGLALVLLTILTLFISEFVFGTSMVNMTLLIAC